MESISRKAAGDQGSSDLEPALAAKRKSRAIRSLNDTEFARVNVQRTFAIDEAQVSAGGCLPVTLLPPSPPRKKKKREKKGITKNQLRYSERNKRYSRHKSVSACAAPTTRPV